MKIGQVIGRWNSFGHSPAIFLYMGMVLLLSEGS
jgi:hypothetical protein